MYPDTKVLNLKRIGLYATRPMLWMDDCGQSLADAAYTSGKAAVSSARSRPFAVDFTDHM